MKGRRRVKKENLADIGDDHVSNIGGNKMSE